MTDFLFIVIRKQQRVLIIITIIIIGLKKISLHILRRVKGKFWREKEVVI